jgi:flagellin
MSSILTNNTAMTALQNLSATQKSLATTQAQISSGLRVSTASDNAAYWSISNTLRSDTGALSAVSDALNLGSAVLGVANAALNSTLTYLNKIKADVVSAQQSGTSTAQVQTDIAAQQQTLLATLTSASLNGVNLLDGSSGTSASFVSSFTRNASGATSLQTLSVSTSGTSGTQVGGAGGILAVSLGAFSGAGVGGAAGTGAGAGTYAVGSLLAINITNASSSDLAKLQVGIDTLIGQVNGAGAQLGSVTTAVTNQQTFVTTLSNALTSGVGSLVDADMNLASTRLQALQTQQQLGIQALSIANQNSQLILKLFG